MSACRNNVVSFQETSTSLHICFCIKELYIYIRYKDACFQSSQILNSITQQTYVCKAPLNASPHIQTSALISLTRCPPTC